MAIKDIIIAFESEIDLPVSLPRIVSWIKSNGFQDDIEFIGVDLDTGILRGFLNKFSYRDGVYGELILASNIYYDDRQEKEWINIVCVKELIHIMDGGASVKTKGDFDTLISRLVLPKELKILLDDPAYALIDKFGDAIAAALLLPNAARNLLIQPYQEGEITAEDIAALAVMPVRYVRLVMSEYWPKVYEHIKAISI